MGRDDYFLLWNWKSQSTTAARARKPGTFTFNAAPAVRGEQVFTRSDGDVAACDYFGRIVSEFKVNSLEPGVPPQGDTPQPRITGDLSDYLLDYTRYINGLREDGYRARTGIPNGQPIKLYDLPTSNLLGTLEGDMWTVSEKQSYIMTTQYSTPMRPLPGPGCVRIYDQSAKLVDSYSANDLTKARFLDEETYVAVTSRGVVVRKIRGTAPEASIEHKDEVYSTHFTSNPDRLWLTGDQSTWVYELNSKAAPTRFDGHVVSLAQNSNDIICVIGKPVVNIIVRSDLAKYRYDNTSVVSFDRLLRQTFEFARSDDPELNVYCAGESTAFIHKGRKQEMQQWERQTSSQWFVGPANYFVALFGSVQLILIYRRLAAWIRLRRTKDIIA